jgi:hypothetical protein
VLRKKAKNGRIGNIKRVRHEEKNVILEVFMKMTIAGWGMAQLKKIDFRESP